MNNPFEDRTNSEIIQLINDNTCVITIARKCLNYDDILCAAHRQNTVGKQIFHLYGHFANRFLNVRVAIFFLNACHFKKVQVFNIARNGCLRNNVILPI